MWDVGGLAGELWVIAHGKACGPSLLSRPKLGSQIQVGADELVCGQREADRARRPPASPPKLQGNFVNCVRFLENPN